MQTIPIEQAQAKLPTLIHELTPGEEVVITETDQPVARLVGERTTRKPRQPGNCQGMLTVVQEDDDHLKDFSEYMP